MPNSYFSKVGAQAGFGLVELMVSISIVVLVLMVVMSNQGSSNSAVLLRSQAYEVALGLREVQLAAVSATMEASGFRNVFGMYFNSDAGSNGFYYTFRDTGNYFYESAEALGKKRNNLDKRFEISQIRTVDGATGTETTEPDISILFKRPNFDAIFYTEASNPAAGASAVEIDVRLKGTSGSGVGEVRTVEVSRTGQIIVQ